VSLTKLLEKNIGRHMSMDNPNVVKIESPVRMSKVFKQDRIQFTESSGKVYVNADSNFRAEIIKLEEEMEMKDTEQQ
jgi:hypothetical protein